MTTTTRRPCRWPFGPDPVQDPPTYDWRDFLGDADALIELPGMSEPVYQRQALARLLAATREVYFNALDDWKSRRADDKPRYGRRDDDEGEGWEGAGAYLRAAYGRPEGNPGTGRTRKYVPVAPLHSVYPMVEQWWREHVGRPAFHPKYRREDEDGPPGRKGRRTFGGGNPAGRLFLLVAQELNERYTPTILENIRRSVQRQRRRELSRLP